MAVGRSIGLVRVDADPGDVISIVTLADLKAHLLIEHSVDIEDNALIAYSKAGTELLERITGRIFAEKNFRQHFPGWSSPFRLSAGPVASVTHVKYLDPDNALQTWDDDNYWLDPSADRLYLVTSDRPHLTTLQRPDRVQVTYQAGDNDNVPEIAVQCVKQIVAEMSFHREIYHEAGQFSRLVQMMMAQCRHDYGGKAGVGIVR